MINPSSVPHIALDPQDDGLDLPRRIDMTGASEDDQSRELAPVLRASRVADTLVELHSERSAQMNEILAAKTRHDEEIARIDAKLKRSQREPTDRHQVMVGAAVWVVLSFGAAFIFHYLGADLAVIESDLVLADFTFVLALIFWVAGTAAVGLYKESAAAKLAERSRSGAAEQLAASTASAEKSIREIETTLDRIHARSDFRSTDKPAPGTVRINPADNAEMVYVAAGTFIMGMPDHEIESIPAGPSNEEIAHTFLRDCIIDNGPSREVHLDGYWIYRYPVTIGQYRRYCAETGSAMPRSSAEIDDDLGDRHPIVHITWHAAKAYCEWAGVRLCTEAEWEKAMRGTDSRRYPWGNEWDPGLPPRTEDWTNRTPVEAFDNLAGPYGAADFYGELSQWCEDLYMAASWVASPSRNPRGPSSNECGRRVIRGGGCGYDPMAYLVSKRSSADPFKAGLFGIRPVSDA